MKLRFWKPETRASSYSDAVVTALLANASGSVSASPTATAVAASCAALWGTVLGSARGGRSAAALPPTWLRQLGYDLVLRGSHVSAIMVDDNLDIFLKRASDYDVSGRDDWRYRLTFPSPSGQYTRTIPAEGVVSILWAENPDQPWFGISPLTLSGLDGTALANISRSLGQEASSTTGFVMALPVDGQDDSVTQLKADLKQLKGGLAITETTSGGWQQGTMQRPQKDWGVTRLGPRPTAESVELRMSLASDIASACGIPPSLIDRQATGTAARSGWSRFLEAVEAMLLVINSELSTKLERDIALSVDNLLRPDSILTLSRSFGQLTKAGLSAQSAGRIVGFDADAIADATPIAPDVPQGV